MMMWPGSLNPSQEWYASLGLGTSQTGSLKKLESSFQKEANELCMTICQERLELLNLMKDKKADREVVNRKIEKIGGLQILLEKQMASHIFEVKKSLTPEQSQAYLDRIREGLRKSIQQCGYGKKLDR